MEAENEMPLSLPKWILQVLEAFIPSFIRIASLLLVLGFSSHVPMIFRAKASKKEMGSMDVHFKFSSPLAYQISRFLLPLIFLFNPSFCILSSLGFFFFFMYLFQPNTRRNPTSFEEQNSGKGLNPPTRRVEINWD